MARQERRVRPGDVANTYIRWILGEVGALLGGLSNEEWARTLAHFDGCCAYTGARLEPEQLDRDHAIPLNAEHAGLHLFGNVLPATKAANAEKHSRHYREFVKDPERLRRIDRFMEESGYTRRIAQLSELSKLCRTEYERITAMCRDTGALLAKILAVPVPARAQPRPTPPPPSAVASRTDDRAAVMPDPDYRSTGAVLPITLDPQPESVFLDAALRQGRAWITVEYRDGRRTVDEWKMPRLSKDSRILGNLRSRPDFRQGHWQAKGIVRVRVSASRPSGA